MRAILKSRIGFVLLAILLSVFLPAKARAGGECIPPGSGPYTPPAADDCCVIPALGGGGTLDACAGGNIPKITAPDTCTCVAANDALVDLFKILNGIMLPLVIILGFFIIVLAGYKILTSQGNPQELQGGKENLTSGIIGLIFVLLAVSILRVIIRALITGNAVPF